MPQTFPGSGSTPFVERVARPAMPPVVAASRSSATRKIQWDRLQVGSKADFAGQRPAPRQAPKLLQKFAALAVVPAILSARPPIWQAWQPAPRA